MVSKPASTPTHRCRAPHTVTYAPCVYCVQDGEWQNAVEGLFKANDPSPALSRQLTALLDLHTPAILAKTIVSTSRHVREHACQSVSEVEWATPLGMLRVPLLIGGGAAIHSTATHAVATTVLHLQQLPPHEEQQAAVRLCGAVLAHLGLLEPHPAVAGYTIAHLLQQSPDPLPLLHDLVSCWCQDTPENSSKDARASSSVLAELLQASSLLPTLHALLLHDQTSCRDAATFHMCSSTCQQWAAVVGCAAGLGLPIEPRSALTALRQIARGMRRATLRVMAEHAAQHWPPYAIMCFSHMAQAAAVAAHYGRAALCGTSTSAEALGAVLACLSEVLQLPAENATTADGLALASALLHAALQLAGSDVVLHAQGGVESLLHMLMRCYNVLAMAASDSSMAGVLTHHLLDLQAKFCMVLCNHHRHTLPPLFVCLCALFAMHITHVCPSTAVGDCGGLCGRGDAPQRSLPPGLPSRHELEGSLGTGDKGPAACTATILEWSGSQWPATIFAGARKMDQC